MRPRERVAQVTDPIAICAIFYANCHCTLYFTGDYGPSGTTGELCSACQAEEERQQQEEADDDDD